MDLAYRHNWPETRRRMEAFWEMEILGRPCISVTAPRQAPRRLRPPLDAKQKGLFILTSARSPEAAEALLAKAVSITAAKHQHDRIAVP